MTDTIKLRQATDMPSEFEDWHELKEFLNAKSSGHEDEIGVLFPLPEEEITDEIREEIRLSKLKDSSEYVDIAKYACNRK